MSTSARVRRRIQTARIPVRFVAEGVEAVGILSNVSRAGVFIRSEDTPRCGCGVAIQFESPDGSLVNLRGHVRWRTPDLAGPNASPGFGVSIQEPAQPYREFFLWATEQVEKEAEPE